MRFLCILLLVSNACLAQFETKWVKSLKMDSINTDDEIFYSFFGDKVYLLNVHAFYKSEITTNPDGSITMSMGIKKSNDSLQKASIYKLEDDGTLQLKNQFEFSPKFQIKQFIVTETDSYLVYGAEMYFLGKKTSFIKEWQGKTGFSEFSFSAESSSSIKNIFRDRNFTSVIACQFSQFSMRPAFYTVNSKEKTLFVKTPDSVHLNYDFMSDFSEGKYYIAGNSRINTDSTDKSPFYSRLLLFDKNGSLRKEENYQLDDSLHHFDVRSLSVQNEEVAITGLLYYRDYKNLERRWIVQAVKKGKLLWSDTLPEGYMPQSVHHTGNSIIVVSLFTNKPGKGYNSYHFLRYNKHGELLENFSLDNIKPEWKNIVVVHVSEKELVFAGKNIFNSLVIEKISF